VLLIKPSVNNSNKGFTLVELVIVIVLLGILSVGISGFLSMGTQIFVDVKNRSSLISSARFAIERVNRDLRSALPNSIRVSTTATGQCIEFIPIIAAASYIDIPAEPNDNISKPIKVIDFGSDEREKIINSGNDATVAVYPLDESEVYGVNPSKIRILESFVINTVNDPEWEITFNNDVLFEEDSPSSTLFFLETPASYCVVGSELRRDDNANDGVLGVLMANNLAVDSSGNTIFPFTLTEDSQFRNSTVLFLLTLEENGERVVFNNEIHIPNAP